MGRIRVAVRRTGKKGSILHNPFYNHSYFHENNGNGDDGSDDDDDEERKKIIQLTTTIKMIIFIMITITIRSITM